LTLYHLAAGELAPMGGDHDLMDPISHHGAKGITQAEAGNRQYLCSVMETENGNEVRALLAQLPAGNAAAVVSGAFTALVEARYGR
jgi:hypothetical protein